MRLQRYFRLNGLDVRGIKPHFCPFVKYYFPHIADKQRPVAFATDPRKFQFVGQFTMEFIAPLGRQRQSRKRFPRGEAVKNRHFGTDF